jgi:hypothetical protein
MGPIPAVSIPWTVKSAQSRIRVLRGVRMGFPLQKIGIYGDRLHGIIGLQKVSCRNNFELSTLYQVRLNVVRRINGRARLAKKMR